MNKLMIAVAMTIALPGAAFAQAKLAPPAAAPNAHAGRNMQNMSCKDRQAMMAAHGGQMAGMQMDHGKMDRAFRSGGVSDSFEQDRHQ